MDFICRICGHDSYGTVPSSNLYICGNCSAVFASPESFSTPLINFVMMSDKAIEPRKITKQAAGYDLFAAHRVTVEPGTVGLVKTDIAIELPAHHEAQVRCRSGLGYKGIQVSNSPGTIDADYRGNLGVLIYNSTGDPFEVKAGDRVAQLLIKPAVHFQLKQVEELSDAERSSGGFGSTGV